MKYCYCMSYCVECEYFQPTNNRKNICTNNEYCELKDYVFGAAIHRDILRDSKLIKANHDNLVVQRDILAELKKLRTAIENQTTQESERW